MEDYSFITRFYKELEAEVPATRKCIERIPEKLYNWKPHETSLAMGYLSVLVAEIPNWIAAMINEGVIDFQTFQHIKGETTAEMVAQFDQYVEAAKKAINSLTTEQLSKHFVLKNGDQVLIDSPLVENLSSTLNHWVHHRGQLTVYMRMNGIAVPSIYGPSADDKHY